MGIAFNNHFYINDSYFNWINLIIDLFAIVGFFITCRTLYNTHILKNIKNIVNTNNNLYDLKENLINISNVIIADYNDGNFSNSEKNIGALRAYLKRTKELIKKPNSEIEKIIEKILKDLESELHNEHYFAIYRDLQELTNDLQFIISDKNSEVNNGTE